MVARRLLALAMRPSDSPPWDRMPTLVSSALVVVPAIAVPVAGCYAIATGGHAIGWDIIAGFLSLIGAIGLALIVAGAISAIRRVRSPLPLLMVATGTTVALIAGVLMAPVLMAGLAM